MNINNHWPEYRNRRRLHGRIIHRNVDRLLDNINKLIVELRTQQFKRMMASPFLSVSGELYINRSESDSKRHNLDY